MPNLLHRNHDDKIMNDQPGAYNDQAYGSGVGSGQPGVAGQQQGFDNMSGQPQTGIGHGAAPGTGMGAGTGGGLMHHHNQQQQFPASDNVPANQNPNAPYANPQSGVHGTGTGTGHGVGAATAGGAVGAGQGVGQQHGAVGAGQGVGQQHGIHGTHGTHNGQDAPLHSSQVQTSSGHSPSTQIKLGKIEHAAGAILCSTTLKAKGDAKIAEGEAVKGQTAELRNAEAMETHAQLARERANVHAARGAVHGKTHDAMGTHGVGNAAYPQAGMGVPNQAGQALR